VNTHVVQPDGVVGHGEPVDPVDVGRRVKGSVEDEAVLAASTADGVVAAPADDGVVAEPASEPVVPGAPDEEIVDLAAGHGVVAHAGVDVVGAGFPVLGNVIARGRAELNHLELVAALRPRHEVAHVEGDARRARHEGDPLVVVAAGRADGLV
jgi:hypothetical protein